MENDCLISVLITNYNTLDFVKLSLYALGKLTKNSYKVLINDNGSNEENLDGLNKIAEDNDNVFVNFRVCQERRSSYAHAEALDILIEMVDTKYTAILDSDCVFLLRDWDSILIEGLRDKVKIIGTPHKKGRHGLKPYDFPFQYAVLFDTEIYKSLKISCMPRDILKGEDTCWEWKPKFINNGYEGRIFSVENTRDYKEGPFGSILCENYYLDNAKLIASHFGRGSSGTTFKYYHKWFFNLPMVSKTIRRYTARKEKRAWMDICRNTIDAQNRREI